MLTLSNSFHTLQRIRRDLRKVARITSRAFVGEIICRDERWYKEIAAWNKHMPFTVISLFPFPELCTTIYRTLCAVQDTPEADSSKFAEDALPCPGYTGDFSIGG